MYRQRNRPERYSRKRFQLDPLFDQIPKDKNGRRKLSDLSDENLLEIANKFIQRERITKITELNRKDSSLLLELRKRDKTKELKFYVETSKISQIREIPWIKKGIITKRIEKILETLPYEPPKHPSGRTNWNIWSEDQKFAFAWRLCRMGEIKGVTDLINYNKQLWEMLRKANLIDELPFETPPKERNIWKGVSDKEVIDKVNATIERRGIVNVGDLADLEPALYGICQKRGIIRELDLEFQRSPRKKANKNTINEKIT